MPTIKFRVKGRSPLLQNNPSAMKPAGDVVLTSAKAKSYSTQDEANGAVYRLLTGDGKTWAKDGQIYHPAQGLRVSLIHGGNSRKIKAKNLSTILKSTIFATDEFAWLTNPDTGLPLTIADMQVFATRVCMGKDKGKSVVKGRALFQRWQTEIEFEHDEMVAPEHIQFAFETAGRVVGIGDYRPFVQGSAGTGGPYGRYFVERIE